MGPILFQQVEICSTNNTKWTITVATKCIWKTGKAGKTKKLTIMVLSSIW